MNPRKLTRLLEAVPYQLSVYQVLRERSILSSADYAEKHLDTAMIFQTPQELWNYAVSTVQIKDGLHLEFGVFKGHSINHFAARLPDRDFHGFDSFEGLAEDWKGYHLPKGTFDLGGKLPDVHDNVTLHKGWFDKTLPDFLKKNKQEVSLCHVDCDTYESSLYVLETLSHRLVPGSVIVFDEYYGYPNWENGEYRAWQEVCAQSKIKYEYVAFANMQVCVIIQ